MRIPLEQISFERPGSGAIPRAPGLEKGAMKDQSKSLELGSWSGTKRARFDVPCQARYEIPGAAADGRLRRAGPRSSAPTLGLGK